MAGAAGCLPSPQSGSIRLDASVEYVTGTAFTYRIALPVERTESGVRALTPRLETCRIESRCGGQAAYVPGSHRDGIDMNVTLSATPA